MRWILILLVMLICTSSCLAEQQDFRAPQGYDQKQENVVYGKMEAKEYFSKSCGKFRRCFVYLPANYDAEKAYPLLFLFHGIGGNESEWTGGRPEVILGNLAAAGEAVEMIAVTPNIKAYPAGTTSTGGMYSPEAIAAFDFFINDLRDDLLPFIKENYKILDGKENMAVAGFSMGGREALYIGLSMPETFGYIGAFAPAPGLLPYTGFTEEGGLFTADTLKAAEGSQPFILINAGDRDKTVGEWPRIYADTLTKNGTENVFYVTQGDHNFFVWKNGLYHFAKHLFK